MSTQDALTVIVCLLDRTPMSKAELIAAQQAIAALQPKPAAATEAKAE